MFAVHHHGAGSGGGAWHSMAWHGKAWRGRGLGNLVFVAALVPGGVALWRGGYRIDAVQKEGTVVMQCWDAMGMVR